MPNGQWNNRQWPADFEDVIRRVRRQLNQFKLGGFSTILGVLAFVALAWSSWYTVQPQETAVVQRFGRIIKASGPGLHFKLPFLIDKVWYVPTARVLKEEFGFRSLVAGRRTQYAKNDFENESLMLTGDLNVIDVQWIVQYRIEDPGRYLFHVRETRDTIRDIAEAVMRRVVGNRLGSDVLTVGRVSVANEVKEEMQKILTDYQTGVRLVTVELQDVTPPDPVKPAFNEVNESRQDRERMVNQAQEQANKEIPKAGGEANRSIAESQGYAVERVNQARGEATRFEAGLKEYQQAREVTRRRLYLEAMNEILPGAKELYVVDGDQRALIPLLSLNPRPDSTLPKEAKEGKQP
jgi:membrane protease subunit HflK